MLAKKLNFKFYDIDYEIEKDCNKTISSIFEEDGEETFRDIETKTIEKIVREDLSVISMGGGAILREENMINAKKNGKVIFIDRPIEDIVNMNDIEIEKRPLLKNGVEKIYELYNQRINLYKKYADIEILNDCDLEQLVNRILEVLE